MEINSITETEHFNDFYNISVKNCLKYLLFVKKSVIYREMSCSNKKKWWKNTIWFFLKLFILVYITLYALSTQCLICRLFM